MENKYKKGQKLIITNFNKCLKTFGMPAIVENIEGKQVKFDKYEDRHKDSNGEYIKLCRVTAPDLEVSRVFNGVADQPTSIVGMLVPENALKKLNK